MLVAMPQRAILLIAAFAACRSPHPSPMYPAGSDKDDGYGDLARMSARLQLGNRSDASPFAPRRARRPRVEPDPYGGDPYGGAAYGSTGATPASADDTGAATGSGGPPGPTTSNGSPIVTALQGGSSSSSSSSAAAPPHYTPTPGLTGAIEGVVTWRGAPPAPLVTRCGAIDNPSVRVAANRTVAGVLVYIEHVDTGRALPSIGRPATVGGIITKRGCALGPPLQILTPLPAELSIHGDATQARLRVTLPGGARPFELQPAGRFVVSAQPGVIRVEADDGTLGPAWVIASNTPYYAITDDRGRFRIDELATGTYDVTFWQPPLATAVGGKVMFGAPVVVHRSVKVGINRPAHVDLALP
jgi:hypothetical protein